MPTSPNYSRNVKLILEIKEGKLSQVELAAKYGYTRSRVQQLCAKYGVALPRKTRPKEYPKTASSVCARCGGEFEYEMMYATHERKVCNPCFYPPKVPHCARCRETDGKLLRKGGTGWKGQQDYICVRCIKKRYERYLK